MTSTTAVELIIRDNPPTNEMRQVCFDWYDSTKFPMVTRLGFATVYNKVRLLHQGRPVFTSVIDVDNAIKEVGKLLAEVRASQLPAAKQAVVDLLALLDWLKGVRQAVSALDAASSAIRAALDAGISTGQIKRIMQDNIDAWNHANARDDTL